MSKLYEIADKYNDLMTLIDFMQVAEMEDPEKLQEGAWERMEQALNEVQDDFKSKIDNIVKIIENMDTDRLMIEMEIERLEKRKARIKKVVENLKDYAKMQMLRVNMKKIKTSLFDVSIQANPPKVNIFNEKLIPQKYYVAPEPVILKSLIKEDLKNGEIVQGAELIQTNSLRIK